MSFIKSRYNSKVAVMATKHDKGRLITPHFDEILSMRVEEVLVDTDLLGTFSGEIERVGTPLETAIKKARLGMERSGNPFGIILDFSKIHLSVPRQVYWHSGLWQKILKIIPSTKTT